MNPENPSAPNDASFQTSGGGPGGILLDLTVTTQVSTGLTVYRERIVPGGDDGSIQSFFEGPAETIAAVADSEMRAMMQILIIEARRTKNLLRALLAEGAGKTIPDRDLDAIEKG